MTGFPWLTILWLLPLTGAAVAFVLPRRYPAAAKWVCLSATLGVLAVTVVLIIDFEPAGPQFQFVESHTWIRSFGAGYTVGIDGIALALVALTAVLMPQIIIGGWNDARDRGTSTNAYLGLLLTVESVVLLSLLALDVLLFYVLFEVTLIPLYFLIGRFGGVGSSQAATKFLLYNLAGGLVMLVAVIGLYVVGSDRGAATMDFNALVSAAGDFAPAVQQLIFGGFMFAFAIKAPLWPFHSWLPGVATAAKPVTAVLMMAVVDKLGTFGMLRYCIQLFPDATLRFQPIVVALAVVSIIVGAVIAIGQTDVMRLIAYTSISHFGFIILGIFAMTPEAQSGSALYMVNHGLSTAALFLIAGFLVSRRGSRLIASYGGVQKVAPVLAGTFLLAGLSALALPGLASFVSEFLVLIGTFTRYPIAAVLASSALVLSAIYILWMYQRIMTGPLGDGNDRLGDLIPRERVVIGPLIALLLVFGIYPKPVLDVINPAVSHTQTAIERSDQAPMHAKGPTR